jgi:tellurite resistance protein
MQKQAKSYIEMAIDSIQAFANDGKLDANELQHTLDIALRDGQIDADEQRVLGKILTQAEKGPLDSEVAALIAQIRLRHGIK